LLTIKVDCKQRGLLCSFTLSAQWISKELVEVPKPFSVSEEHGRTLGQ